VDDHRGRCEELRLLELSELLAGALVETLGQVHVQGGHVAGVDLGPHLGRVLGGRATKVDHRARLVLAEDAQVDVADERLLLAGVLPARALDRRRAADERARLGVAGEIPEE
jgi:hypothetical protein